ncbi:MAG: Hpt domain-containing protein [Flavobacteriales bacterium]|nr:Hpt domain-containing protein [Flavobacteriales bacterium]
MDRFYELTELEKLAEGDAAFIKDIVLTFVEHVPMQVIEIEKAFENSDYNKLAAKAHKIKPSIDIMGISALKQVVRDVENICNNQTDIDKLDGLVSQLVIVIKNVINELKSDFHIEP